MSLIKGLCCPRVLSRAQVCSLTRPLGLGLPHDASAHDLLHVITEGVSRLDASYAQESLARAVAQVRDRQTAGATQAPAASPRPPPA